MNRDTIVSFYNLVVITLVATIDVSFVVVAICSRWARVIMLNDRTLIGKASVFLVYP